MSGRLALESGPKKLVGSMPRVLETNSGIASFLHTADFFGLGLDYDRRLPALLKSIPAPTRIELSGGMTPARFVELIYADAQFRRWGVSRAAVELSFHATPPSSYVDAVRHVYTLWAAQRGRSRYGDKTADHVLGLGTIAGYLMATVLWTGVARARFAGNARPWVWRWGP